MNDVLLLMLLTLAPFLELRASIPYGIFATKINLFWVVFIAIVVNAALAPILYIVVNYVVELFRHIPFIDDLWKRIIVRAQRKVYPYVEKYGVVGLGLFIGIPLPGSGVYTGTLGAYALGFKFRKFFIASIIGVIMAAAAVTLISLFGEGVWLLLIK